MIKVLIKKQDQITNQAQFSSNEEAEQWLARHQEMKSFGLPQRQVEVVPAVIDEDGSEVSPAQFETLPAEYEVVIEDISSKIEQDKINSEAQAFLDSTDYKVLRHLRQKSLSQEPSLSDSEYLALEQQRSEAASRIVK